MNEGRRREKPVVIAGMRENKKREKNREWASRLAWSKVPVTITSLASVYGLFLSSGGN
jgi:hypothetical protein